MAPLPSSSHRPPSAQPPPHPPRHCHAFCASRFVRLANEQRAPERRSNAVSAWPVWSNDVTDSSLSPRCREEARSKEGRDAPKVAKKGGLPPWRRQDGRTWRGKQYRAVECRSVGLATPLANENVPRRLHFHFRSGCNSLLPSSLCRGACSIRLRIEDPLPQIAIQHSGRREQEAVV